MSFKDFLIEQLEIDHIIDECIDEYIDECIVYEADITNSRAGFFSGMRTAFDKEYKEFMRMYSSTSNSEDYRVVYNEFSKYLQGVKSRSSNGQGGIKREYSTPLSALGIKGDQMYNSKLKIIQALSNARDLKKLKKMLRQTAESMYKYKVGIDRRIGQRKTRIQKGIEKIGTGVKNMAVGGAKALGGSIEDKIGQIASNNTKGDPYGLIARGLGKMINKGKEMYNNRNPSVPSLVPNKTSKFRKQR